MSIYEVLKRLLVNRDRPKFLSPEEIVSDILEVLDKDWLNAVKRCEQEHLSSFHPTLGRWIRNHYRLWHKDNPFTLCNSYLGAHSPHHPDSLTEQILQMLWERLNHRSHRPGKSPPGLRTLP